MRELSAAQKEAIKKRIRRACCDLARKMGMTAAFTSTGIRVANADEAYVFDFRWNHLINTWDLYHSDAWLAGGNYCPHAVIVHVRNQGMPHGN